MSSERQDITLRTATADDGAGIWTLVKEAGTLDLNSSYAYLLMADRFGDTCIVAERDGKVVGFVVAFIPPRQPEVVFVWQIGVHPSARGQGLGRRILQALVDAPACEKVRYMETTVTRSNEASEAMFRSFARHSHSAVELVDDRSYRTEQFPDGKETERLFRIGPFGEMRAA